MVLRLKNQQPIFILFFIFQLVQQLKSTYRIQVDQNKTDEDKCAIIDELDSDFVEKQSKNICSCAVWRFKYSSNIFILVAYATIV